MRGKRGEGGSCRSHLVPDDDGTLARLRRAVIGREKNILHHVEAQAAGMLFDGYAFGRLEKLGHVFDHEHGGAAALDDIHERKPERPAAIAHALLVQEAEALARRTANYDVGLRNRLICRDPFFNVAAVGVRSEILPMRFGRGPIEVQRPDAVEAAAEPFIGKAEGHAAGTSEQVNQSEGHFCSKRENVAMLGQGARASK